MSDISRTGTSFEYIPYPRPPEYNTTQGQFIRKQDLKFNTLLPYGYPLPPDKNSPTDLLNTSYGSVITADPFLGKAQHSNKTINNFNNLFYTNTISRDIINNAQRCREATMDSLIQSENRNAPMRCGWIFNSSSEPKVSQGFLGTKYGPFKFLTPAPPDGEWFWNLEDAQKNVLKDRCNTLTACQLVGTPNFNSCGFCQSTGKGVPINNQLQSKYQDIPCNGTLFTDSSRCPRVQENVSVNANGLMSNGQRPGINDRVNGRFSKESILDAITSNGCSQNGALYTAINASNNNENYIQNIENSESFRIYKERIASFNPNIFKTGQTETRDNIISQVITLKDNATSTRNPPTSALGAASRDLCTVRGAIDEWDPCVDIPNETRPPYDLRCLQNNFRRIGGQAAGSDYPTSQTLVSLYNKFSSYGQVKEHWNKLIRDSKSSSYNVQRKAMIKFYGIDPHIQGIDEETEETQRRININFSDIGDIGFPHIKFGISNDTLFIRENVINSSIDNQVDPGLNATILLNNIKRGVVYKARISNDSGKEIDVLINDAYPINDTAAGTRYAIAFKFNKNINTELNNPSKIAVVIF